MDKGNYLDSPDREMEILETIQGKDSLNKLYKEFYLELKNIIHNTNLSGDWIELGSGASFAKTVIPQIVTSDIIKYKNVDKILDATNMSLVNNSVAGFLLLNVLHHIPDADAFFSECVRCLKPGGKIGIIDQFPGFISTLILNYFHHEPFDSKSKDWKFPSSGPLSSANGALPWIIFFRDKSLFNLKYPQLEILSIKKHTPLRYWMAGGLKPWSALPSFLFPLFTFLDRTLTYLIPNSASFMTIEIIKKL